MFDYIIVGAGSAGCVLANRLTEDPNTSVLLLEAGGPDDNPKIPISAHWPQMMRSELDWAYETEPQSHLHGRAIYWPRGKVLGGSSSTNGMMYVRGSAYDYDHWAAQGNEGWSYNEVLPYFKKSEHNERGASDYHGVGGLLNIADLIEPNPITQAMVEAAIEVGIPANLDSNGAQQEGVGLSQATHKDGKRHSTAIAFLKPAMQRTNLTVETHAQVTRLLVEKTRIVGVSYMQNGETREVRVNKEVILSGGAINSPQILLLSGIGPAAHLQAHGIPVVVDLPGVGQNLHDHPGASLQYRPSQPLVVPLSSTLGEGNVFVKTRPDVPAPDLQLILYTEEGLYSFVIVGLRPESRGALTLASADPFAAPHIDPNYLDSERDMQVMFDGFKIARRIGEVGPKERLRTIQQMMVKCSPEHLPVAVSNDPLFEPPFLRIPDPPQGRLFGFGDRSAILSSRNWSGAVTMAVGGERLQTVAGCWAVPAVTRPASGVEAVVCSTWVGFDGHRRHAPSMPQVGTVQGWYQGKYFSRAWHQWWVAGLSEPPRWITSLSVKAGDRMAAWMERIEDGRKVRIFFANLCTNKIVAYRLGVPEGAPAVEGKSAQWIVERTKMMDKPTKYPLAAFSDATFFEWAAAGQALESSDDRLITSVRLYERDGTLDARQTRIRVSRKESAPSANDRLRRRGADITVTYKA